MAKTGADALSRFGLGNGVGIAQIMRTQLTITGMAWGLALFGLTLTKQRYLEMKTPENDNAPER
jgi:hypothetical protein